MKSVLFRKTAFLPVVLVGILVNAPVLSGQHHRIEPTLSVHQKVEILFQNGLRNGHRAQGAFAQVRAFQRTLSQISDLRGANPKQHPKDERAMNLRERQLRRLIR